MPSSKPAKMYDMRSGSADAMNGHAKSRKRAASPVVPLRIEPAKLARTSPSESVFAELSRFSRNSSTSTPCRSSKLALARPHSSASSASRGSRAFMIGQ